ncbi:hypothetical protein DFR70_103821 [Nocardia tenerifensis]|uniref:Uncharacterized protein n=1 Tax=Nocardia tenerifensis TaxID=228006 RepID=A0A318KB97_9NOCA|nr:hypothetical protein [Nocardia tenerifensis]PXX67065.1 hypothetical protein DFR70_103821 [Nocardia tenerifensis]
MTGTAFSFWPAPLRSGTPSQPPRAVLVAFIGLVVALLAGVAEAIERTALTLERDQVDMADLATGLAVRLGIYLVVLLVAVRMTHGARWARLLLTFGIGVIGLLSLIVEPLAALLSADRFGDLFAGFTLEAAVIGLFRTVHIVAVLVAIPAMYHPAARRYFARSPRPAVERNSNSIAV